MERSNVNVLSTDAHLTSCCVEMYVQFAHSIRFYECMAKGLSSLQVTFTPVSGSKQDPTLTSVQPNSIFK